MHVLLLSFAVVTAAKLELEEEPIEVSIPKLGDKDSAAVNEALAVIKAPASTAALHEAVKVCALLGIDVTKPMAAAKSGAADGLDARLLAIADGYLGIGDFANAEKVLLVTRPNAGVHERLGRVLHAQSRFADAAKAYVASMGEVSGPELDEIVRRIEPIVKAWVADYEAGHSAVMRDAAKAVLSAMLPHQAGDDADTTSKRLARLDPPAGKWSPAPLNVARLREALLVQVPALRGCYARALVHEPTMKGKLVVELSVDENGKVVSPRTTTNGTGSKRLASCVESRLKVLNLVTTTPADAVFQLVFAPL